MANIELNAFLDQHLSSSRDTTTVDVFPLMCGLGKSSYIRHAIMKALLDGTGLIVITDKIAGLKDYTHSDREDERELNEYLLTNRNHIAVLYHETIADETPSLFGRNAKPVILMTTQRYFSHSASEIAAFTAGSKKRPTIIFDEKPYFTERQKIGIAELNRIDTAINAIDNTARSRDKEWMLQQWSFISQQIRLMFAKYEAKNTDTEEIFWQEHTDRMSEDDERFLALVDRYKKKFDLHKADICKDLLVIRQMFDEGATFVSNKRLGSKDRFFNYCNYFTVVLDNMNKFLDVGAKVFVFDGTADLSPDYDLDYINMIDCQQYQRKLPNLTICLVNAPTDKTRLTSKAHRHEIDAIIRYIGKCWKNPVIFTYKSLQKPFQEHFNTVNYFGNIKGSNEYREATDIIQVGVNRFTSLAYQELTYFNRLATRQRHKKMVKVIGPKAAEKTMNRAILEDIEQNAFRSAIRNHDCNVPVTYTIFLPCYTKDEDGNIIYTDLVSMIKERFEGYGATVEVHEMPMELKLSKMMNRNTERQTYPQRIIEWLYAHVDHEFGINEMFHIFT